MATKAIRTPKKYLEYTINPKKKKLTKEEKNELREREIYSSLIKNQAQRINASYKALEKAGMEGQSQSYKTIEHYAVTDPKGKGKNFIVDYAKGSVRVSGDTRKMSVKEMKEYSEQLGQILKHKTRTLSGTKAAVQKAYEKAKKDYDFGGSFEDYEKIWDMYRDNVSEDRKQKLDSETVISIMENTTIYDMTDSDMDKALEYIYNSKTGDEAELKITDIQEVINIINDNEPEEAARIIKYEGIEEVARMFPTLAEKIMEFL